MGRIWGPAVLNPDDENSERNGGSEKFDVKNVYHQICLAVQKDDVTTD